jgi:outer membrane protein
MKMRFVSIFLAALSITPAAMAQINMHQPAQVTLATKIGVVNLRVAILGTAEGKQAASQFQVQFAPRYAEIQNLQAKIEADQTRLRNGQSTLADQAKDELSEQIALMERSYQRRVQDVQDEATDAHQEVADRIGRRMVGLLSKYSAENGFAIVLDSSSQQTPVLYATNEIDLTEQLIALYDQSYPVKAAEQPKTAAPK